MNNEIAVGPIVGVAPLGVARQLNFDNLSDSETDDDVFFEGERLHWDEDRDMFVNALSDPPPVAYIKQPRYFLPNHNPFICVRKWSKFNTLGLCMVVSNRHRNPQYYFSETDRCLNCSQHINDGFPFIKIQCNFLIEESLQDRIFCASCADFQGLREQSE